MASSKKTAVNKIVAKKTKARNGGTESDSQKDSGGRQQTGNKEGQ